jgi:hypothetical protein
MTAMPRKPRKAITSSEMTVGELVDALGTIKARVADLTATEKVLRDALAGHGPGEYEGDRWRATVSVGERSNLDMDAVRAKLSPQFIAAHTTTTPTTTVKVVARTRK